MSTKVNGMYSYGIKCANNPASDLNARIGDHKTEVKYVAEPKAVNHATSKMRAQTQINKKCSTSLRTGLKTERAHYIPKLTRRAEKLKLLVC